MKKSGLILLILTLAASISYGQGYINIFGRYDQYQTARNLGLGGAGMASETGVGAFFMNPALMSKQVNNLELRLGFGLNNSEEERAVRIYDSFDNYLTNQIYAMQTNNFYKGLGAVTWQTPFLSGMSAVIGLGTSRIWDFNYDYEEQLRNPDPFNQNTRDQLFGYNSLSSSGNIYETALAFSLSPFENFYIGLKAGILTGEINQHKWVNAVEENNPPFADSTIYNNNYIFDSTPITANISIAHQVDDRFTYGVRLNMPYTMTFEGGYQYDVPLIINMGLDYRARNILWARINVDIEYAFWSDVNYKWDFGSAGSIDGNPNWRDTWTVKAGIEHIFHEAYPFRIGFNYQQIPQQEEINNFLFTLGTGFLTGNFTFDISGGIGSKNYQMTDIFPNSLNGAPDRTGDDANDQVKDIYFEFMATITYAF